MQFGDVDLAVLHDQVVGDMDADGLAENHGVFIVVGGVRQIIGADQLALEMDRTFHDPRRLDQGGRNGRQAGFGQLVDAFRRRRGRVVHRRAGVPGREVLHELAGLQDIAEAVFHAVVLNLAVARREHHGRRIVGDAVEERVGRQIDVAVSIERADPTNGPGHDQRVEGVFRQAVAVFRFIKHACSAYLLSIRAGDGVASSVVQLNTPLSLWGCSKIEIDECPPEIQKHRRDGEHQAQDDGVIRNPVRFCVEQPAVFADGEGPERDDAEISPGEGAKLHRLGRRRHGQDGAHGRGEPAEVEIKQRPPETDEGESNNDPKGFRPVVPEGCGEVIENDQGPMIGAPRQ